MIFKINFSLGNIEWIIIEDFKSAKDELRISDTLTLLSNFICKQETLN